MSATFDDSNLVSAGGLIAAMALAVKTCLGKLADQSLTLPGYFGANARLNVDTLVAGMVAGADSIDDIANRNGTHQLVSPSTSLLESCIA